VGLAAAVEFWERSIELFVDGACEQVQLRFAPLDDERETLVHLCLAGAAEGGSPALRLSLASLGRRLVARLQEGAQDSFSLRRHAEQRYLISTATGRAVRTPLGNAFTRPQQRQLLERLGDLGVVHLTSVYAQTIRPAALARALDPEDPIHVFAVALLGDSRAQALSLTGRRRATPVVARGTRLLVHEMRNALSPLDMTLDGLERDLELNRSVGPRLAQMRRAMRSAFGTVGRFATIAAATEEVDTFAVVPAIEEAAALVRNGSGPSIAVELEARLPDLVWPRAGPRGH